MPTTTYTFTGYSDNTDVGSVTDWSRVWGTSGWATAMADGEVDFNTTDNIGAGYAVNTGQADHAIKMVYGSGKKGANFFPVAVRVVDENNNIRARIVSGSLQLYKIVGGTGSQVGSNFAVSINDTNSITLEATGTTIKVYTNDTLRITETITDLSTATKCGFIARSETATGLITTIDVTYTPSGLSITSVTPSSFDDGRTGIVIAGSGFGASQGSSTLTIGGQAQTVTAWSDTSITFTSVRGSNSMGAQSLKLTRG